METDILGGRHVEPIERPGAVRRLRRSVARGTRPPSRTRDTYASQLAHILDEFETVELRQITPSAVRRWHGRLAKSDLHANTVAKVYRLFRTMMDTAVDDGLLRMNPVHIKGAAVERSSSARRSTGTTYSASPRRSIPGSSAWSGSAPPRASDSVS